MNRRHLFSERLEIGRPAQGLIYHEISPRVNDGLINLLGRIDCLYQDSYISHVYERLDRISDMTGGPRAWSIFLGGLKWNEFYDVCEALWEIISGQVRDDFSNGLNDLFARHYIGYQLRDGEIERVGARAQDAAIAEARGILRDPDLSGPDEQFQKAVGFFNLRPEPDTENCVKEAVSAVEGVAQILLNDRKLTLSKALSRLQNEQDVHPTLISLLEKLYAYRSNAKGVGHARTGDKEVRIEDAEFALAVSASAIVYLARLYGRGVV